MKVTGKKGRLRAARKQEEFSPMEGLGNMADAMLVFACGLILALIISWNVNVSETGEITGSPDGLYEVDGVTDGVVEQVDTTNLQEMGTVYQDPETGNYYLVQE
ncbi:MAG: DUF2149 domain-containing protein [Firmicutes bacterium]|nr:DUF2149 domain-containing protein [Bacillota bacterium]